MASRIWTARDSGEVNQNPPTVTIKYGIVATSDTEAYSLVLAEAASSIDSEFGLLYRQTIRVTPSGGGHYTSEVPYGPKDREEGSYVLSLDVTGATVTRKTSRECLAVYPDTFAKTQIIGFDGTEVVGMEDYVPSAKLSVSVKQAQGTLTADQIAKIEYTYNKVNNSRFLLWDAGEILVVGSNARQTESEAEISYQFAIERNERNITIGTITIPFKRGWDYADIQWKSNTVDGKPVQQPECVRIQRVKEYVNLANLLGFG